MPSCTPSAPASRAAIAFDSMIHLHLHVAELAPAVAFYRALFGEAPVKERPGYAKFLPAWAPVNLALSEHPTAAGGPLSHVGVQLPDAMAVQTHLARVKAAGLPTRVEIGVDCCHANQDKFWVRDPAGTEWEIYVLNHDLAPTPAATGDAVSTCCTPGHCG